MFVSGAADPLIDGADRAGQAEIVRSLSVIAWASAMITASISRSR